MQMIAKTINEVHYFKTYNLVETLENFAIFCDLVLRRPRSHFANEIQLSNTMQELNFDHVKLEEKNVLHCLASPGNGGYQRINLQTLTLTHTALPN
jgi:hypothetical protein